MTKNINIINADVPIFYFDLKGKTRKGQLNEIFKELKGVYPSEVSEDDVYFAPYEKNKFIVYVFDEIDKDKKYISRELYKKNHKINEEISDAIIISSYKSKDLISIYDKNETIRHTLLITLIVVVLFSLMFTIVNISRNRSNSLREKNRRDRMLLENQRRERESLQREAETLEKKYLDINENRVIPPYLALEIITRNIYDKGTIENLSIEGNTFNVSVSTSDSLIILESFKNDKSVSKAELTRFNVNNSREFATYQGNFSKNSVVIDESQSIEDKISYYKSYIERYNSVLSSNESGDILSTLQKIRQILKASSCKEEYIQQSINNGFIDVEFYFTSDSFGLINFLRTIKEDVGELSSVRVRRTDNSIQTTIRVKTGIKDDSSLSYTQWEEENTTSTTNMSKAFNDNTIRVEKAVEKTSSVSRDYQYIGSARSRGKRIAIFKNQRTSRLYKLEIVDDFNNALDNTDVCVMVNDSRYTIRIDGLLFDVVK